MSQNVQVLPQRSDSRQVQPWQTSMAMANLIFMFAARAKQMITRRLIMLSSTWGIRSKMELPYPHSRIKAGSLDWSDNSNTNHACFFDFDRDGDLDVFLLNHRLDLSTATKLRLKQELDGSITRITEPATPFESNRLYRNDNGKFVDVGAKAGSNHQLLD
jgi:hypothetical protein